MSSINTYKIGIIHNNVIVFEDSFSKLEFNNKKGEMQVIVDKFKELLYFDISQMFISDSIYDNDSWVIKISDDQLTHLRNSKINDILI